jgi:hypothetical protein
MSNSCEVLECNLIEVIAILVISAQFDAIRCSGVCSESNTHTHTHSIYKQLAIFSHYYFWRNIHHNHKTYVRKRKQKKTKTIVTLQLFGARSGIEIPAKCYFILYEYSYYSLLLPTKDRMSLKLVLWNSGTQIYIYISLFSNYFIRFFEKICYFPDLYIKIHQGTSRYIKVHQDISESLLVFLCFQSQVPSSNPEGVEEVFKSKSHK